MGRPPLFLVRLHISLTAHAMNRLDRLVGEKGRSAFIRKAVDLALDAAETAGELKRKDAKRGIKPPHLWQDD
jgi:metal-responsive CopG/Arc/MetJ family transcriptional regulator